MNRKDTRSVWSAATRRSFFNDSFRSHQLHL